MPRKIGIFINPQRDPGLRVTEQLLKEIQRQGVQAILEREQVLEFSDFNERIQVLECLFSYGSFKECELLICLGGDGTFLSAAHYASAEDLPVIGINLGSVGFLPSVQIDEIDSMVSQLVNGQYTCEKRMLLSVTHLDADKKEKGRYRALNDAVISRGGYSRILTTDLLIDGKHIERIPADGLIVATPTGSTAYSLSSGGPITHPQLEVLLITPISPHTLHNRSYVTCPNSVVQLNILEYPYPVALTIDGRISRIVETGDCIMITKDEHYATFVRLGEDKFFSELPKKIQLRGIPYSG